MPHQFLISHGLASPVPFPTVSEDSWEQKGTYCVVAISLGPECQTIQLNHPVVENHERIIEIFLKKEGMK